MAASKKIVKTKKGLTPAAGFLFSIPAPAKRALEQKGITTLKQLSRFNETEILQLHGMGQSTIPKLQTAIKLNDLSFTKIDASVKLTKPSAADKVDTYMKKLNHPLKNVAEALRKIILSTEKKIGEEIFWNAPSFFYTGQMKPFYPKEYKRFILGFNLFLKDCVRVIFLTGAKLNGTSGLPEGDYADKEMVTITG